jgi:hypothetical protein
MHRTSLVLASALLCVASIVACDPGGGSCADGPCYGWQPPSYGPYPGYPSYDAALPPAPCRAAFSVTIPIPADAGTCQIALREPYFSSQDTAIYYLPEEPDGGDEGSTCEALGSPSLATCRRVHDVVVLASSVPEEIAALRRQLGLQEGSTGFGLRLTCAHVATSMQRDVPFTCASSTPAAPTPSPTDDAGATPDAAETEDAGCDAP